MFVASRLGLGCSFGGLIRPGSFGVTVEAMYKDD